MRSLYIVAFHVEKCEGNTILEVELLGILLKSLDEKISLPLIVVVVPHTITCALDVNDQLSIANPVYNIAGTLV